MGFQGHVLSTVRPRIADLFCGAGGAAMGLHRAGFDVVGFDIKPQPRYPFEFHQADALTVDLSGYDAVWASPPCQRWVTLTQASWMAEEVRSRERPDLLTPTIERLRGIGKPFIIENIPTSPLPATVILCGSMFGLRVRRHRKFMSDIMFLQPQCKHAEQGPPIGVYGNGGPKNPGGRGRRCKNKAEASEAMGIDWMALRELKEAVPPAYSEYLGRQLAHALAQATRGVASGDINAP